MSTGVIAIFAVYVAWRCVNGLPRGKAIALGIALWALSAVSIWAAIMHTANPGNMDAVAWLEQRASELEMQCGQEDQFASGRLESFKSPDERKRACVAYLILWAGDNGVSAVYAPGVDKWENWMHPHEVTSTIDLPVELARRGWWLVRFT